MLIDPFTVIAQIVNFAILAYALKRLLYARVIRAMDEREASIAARLTDAEQREREAHDEADGLRHERAQLDRERHQLLDEARNDAARHGQELLEHARDDVEEERSRWQRGLASEQREFRLDLERRTTAEVVELSRLALSDLAQERLDRAILDRAIDDLAQHDHARTAILIGDDAKTPIRVRTAFGVAPEDRQRTIERLRSIGLEPDRPVRFDTDSSLVLGVEFRGDGQSVSWNAADYLDRLDASLDEMVARLDRAPDDR